MSNIGNPLQRRSGDPRDRIRKEHDGIVLSPQRRSFNSGCYVPVREPPRSNRSHSPLGKGETPSHIGQYRNVRAMGFPLTWSLANIILVVFLIHYFSQSLIYTHLMQNENNVNIY